MPENLIEGIADAAGELIGSAASSIGESISSLEISEHASELAGKALDAVSEGINKAPNVATEVVKGIGELAANIFVGAGIDSPDQKQKEDENEK